MFNFETNISDHPTLTGVKRRFINTYHSQDHEAKVIKVIGKVFYFKLINGQEITIGEIGSNGYLRFALEASNDNKVDVNGNRVDPDGGDGSGTPEYDFWMAKYYDLVKTQGLPVSIFDLFEQQIIVEDNKGFFNL